MEARRVPKLGGVVSVNRRLNEIVVSTKFDLSGSATVDNVYYANYPMRILEAKLVYTENSSADAGVAVSVGKVGDADYFVGNTNTEINKMAGYEQILTPLIDGIEAGTLINITCAGGKTGTGEVVLVLVLEGSNK